MKNKRRLMFQIGTVLVLIAIGALMMWIGRGHTVYFDNKTLEYNGETYSAFQRVNVYVGTDVTPAVTSSTESDLAASKSLPKPDAKLNKKERGMATCMGQKISFTLEVTVNKGDDPVYHFVTLDLPYNMDGIVVNIPGYLASLPQDAWQSEFVPLVTQEEDEEIVTDEFGIDGLDV